MPIPTAAIALTSFILTFYKEGEGFSEFYAQFIIPLVILLSLLMVSKIKYDTLPAISVSSFKEKPLTAIFLALALIAMLITKGKALFYIFVIILLFGILRHVYYLLSRKK